MIQKQILDVLLEKDDISWKSLLYDIVKSEGMSPWDVDVAKLTEHYLDIVKKLKELDLRVSGKVVLAAALLLKMKSTYLISEDIDRLDQLFASTDEEESGEFVDEFGEYVDPETQRFRDEKLPLIPKTPQSRSRKVSIQDLTDALQKAMEVKKRSVVRSIPEEELYVPRRNFEIGEVIKDVYFRVKDYFFRQKGANLTFSQLLPKDASKEDKIYTFIPLLHLTNQRKVDLNQNEHFGEIYVSLLDKSAKEVDLELGIE